MDKIINCVVCGKETIDKSKNQNKKYCSNNCNVKAYYGRHIEKKREYAREYTKNKSKDPNWRKKNAESQAENRKRDPDAFNYRMAKCYLKRLSVERQEELLKEIG